ncbi:MAG: hypothetical protein HQL31_01715 [Planctomycetes bacterium]|nr:hypothetical protein [Planctomycetota bacterium]
MGLSDQNREAKLKKKKNESEPMEEVLSLLRAQQLSAHGSDILSPDSESDALPVTHRGPAQLKKKSGSLFKVEADESGLESKKTSWFGRMFQNRNEPPDTQIENSAGISPATKQSSKVRSLFDILPFSSGSKTKEVPDKAEHRSLRTPEIFTVRQPTPVSGVRGKADAPGADPDSQDTMTDSSQSDVNANKSSSPGFFQKYFRGSKDKGERDSSEASSPAGNASLVPPLVAPGLPQVDASVSARIANQKNLQNNERRTAGRVAFERGMGLFRQFRFDEALQMFNQAHQFIPEDEELQRYIAKTRQVLGERASDVQVFTEWIGENRSVGAQEVTIQIDSHIREARDRVLEASRKWDSGMPEEQSLALADLEEAKSNYRRALDATAWVSIGTDVSQQKKMIHEGIQLIENLESIWKDSVTKKVHESARDKAQALEESISEYNSDKLYRLILQAKTDYLNEYYSKSERLCLRILKEYPKNPDAKRLLDKSRRRMMAKSAREIHEKSEDEWKKNIEKIKDASIAYSDTLVYSDEWDIIRQRKIQTVRKIEDPEWKKKIRSNLERPVNLTVLDHTLQEAIEQLQEQVKDINFQIDRGIFLDNEARIGQLKLRDVSLHAALIWLLKSVPSDSKLIYDLQDGAIFITTKERLSVFEKPERVQYDVNDLITSFSDFDPGSEGLSGGSLSNVNEARTGETISSGSLQDLIRTSVNPESWSEESGISINEVEPGKLLIAQTPDAHQQIVELLSKFRRQQSMQVNIEARFITSRDDDLFDIGVEWKGIQDRPLEDSGVVTGTGVHSSRNDLEADTRVAVLLGSAGSAISKGDRYIRGNTSTTGFLAQLTVLDPIRAGLALHALSEKKTAKSLLAPRLTVLNNKQGYLVRSQDTSFIQSYSNNNGDLLPSIRRVSAGELLVVRPIVSSDKKYITMDLSPQVTRLLAIDSQLVTFPVGTGGANGGANATATTVDATIELPVIQVWQLQTRVQVPDGGVVFVGGRMGNRETITNRGTPILSKIPVIGRLFRADAEGSELDNLIISVRARILLFEELESKL